MARDLGSDAGLRTQRGNGDNGSQDTAKLVNTRLRGGVAQQRAVVRVQDVHGQVGVRRRQLRDQLLAVRLVDSVPQGETALVQLRDRVGDTVVSICSRYTSSLGSGLGEVTSSLAKGQLANGRLTAAAPR